MKLNINGEEKNYSDSMTVRQLLKQLGLESQYIAVERNRIIVSHKEFDITILQDGDTLEILTLVGGG